MGEMTYAQEHLAQFAQMAGAYFSPEYFTDSIYFTEWPFEKCRFRLIAVDPSVGRTDRSDYTAFTYGILTDTGQLYVDAVIDRLDSYQIVKTGLSLYKEFGADAFGVEINQFQEVLADDFIGQSRKFGVSVPVHKIINTFAEPFLIDA